MLGDKDTIRRRYCRRVIFFLSGSQTSEGVRLFYNTNQIRFKQLSYFTKYMQFHFIKFHYVVTSTSGIHEVFYIPVFTFKKEI